MIADSVLAWGGSVVSAVINALRTSYSGNADLETSSTHRNNNDDVRRNPLRREALRGITYSEFDNIVGPQLRFQYPPDVLSKESFEDVSSYVIVGKHLSERVITVSLPSEGMQFMNYSVAIDNPKYERNTLLLAIGFLLDEDAKIDVYESVLSKLTKLLISLEIEREYLFLDTTKSHMQSLFSRLYSELVMYSEAFVHFDSANYLCAQLHSPDDEFTPKVINDDDVPIFLSRNPYALSNLPWDISILHLIPFIDGFSCVLKLSTDAAMDVNCVKCCLRILHYYNCILISDIFQFSNAYSLTNKVDALLSIGPTISAVQTFCTIDIKSPPPISRILRFVVSLRGAVSVGQMLLTKKYNLHGIDIRKLLAIVQSFGIVRRIRRYPVPIPNRLNDDNPSGLTVFIQADNSREEEKALTPRTKNRDRKFNGASTVEDVLLLRADMTAKELYRFPNIVFINK